VLYLPAKDTVLSLGRDATDEEIEEKRREKSKRTGIALNDEALLKAMDKSGTRLVFKTKRDGEAPVKIASAERLGMLAKLVRKNLADIGAELEKGSIGAEPCYIGSNRLPCEYCEFASACPFDPGKDRARRFKKMTDEDFWQRLEKGGGDRA
jgi:ATP-dependent helicase/nuclease subunit B